MCLGKPEILAGCAGSSWGRAAAAHPGEQGLHLCAGATAGAVWDRPSEGYSPRQDSGSLPRCPWLDWESCGAGCFRASQENTVCHSCCSVISLCLCKNSRPIPGLFSVSLHGCGASRMGWGGTGWDPDWIAAVELVHDSSVKSFSQACNEVLHLTIDLIVVLHACLSALCINEGKLNCQN